MICLVTYSQWMTPVGIAVKLFKPCQPAVQVPVTKNAAIHKLSKAARYLLARA